MVGMPGRPRILCLSFSELVADARVLRQLDVLADAGEVTTVGYGARPPRAADHLELDASLPSLPQTPRGVLSLALRRYSAVELDAPAVRAASRAIAGRSFDLVVANEARALPLAHAVAGGAPVWGDLHEWAPEERSHVLVWRLLVAPFMRWICARHLSAAAAVTTVNDSIAALYTREFGIGVEVVRNAIAYRDLVPGALDQDRIRLVHSGGAVPGRNLEALIDAVQELGEGWSLDFYLVGARDGGAYLADLEQRAAGSDRIVFHPPVPPADLPATLNPYDVGVFLLPPHTTNHRLMLPNKLFDFVQARLALVFGPADETTALIERHGLGRVTRDTTAESLVEVLRGMTADDIRSYKAGAHVAARELHSGADERVQRAIVDRLLAVAGSPA